MALEDKILNLLRTEQEESHSGESMAKNFHVSRNAVWKSVQNLKKKGYQIQATTNRGYTLLSECDVLTAGAIELSLGLLSSEFQIEVRKTVTSTNTLLKGIAELGAPEGYVLIAEEQTEGRGRRGKAFYSPEATGIYMSLLLRPNMQIGDSILLTTAAAVAVSEAIELLTGETAWIKWVNDVFCMGKKVCGILTEASLNFETQMLDYAILGIGINIQTPKKSFPTEVKEIAGVLFDKEPTEGIRVKLAAEVLRKFWTYYKELSSRSFMDTYRRKSFLRGMDIDFEMGSQKYHGKVLDIDKDAQLVVKLDTGEVQSFFAGEITINKKFMQQLQ